MVNAYRNNEPVDENSSIAGSKDAEAEKKLEATKKTDPNAQKNFQAILADKGHQTQEKEIAEKSSPFELAAKKHASKGKVNTNVTTASTQHETVAAATHKASATPPPVKRAKNTEPQASAHPTEQAHVTHAPIIEDDENDSRTVAALPTSGDTPIATVQTAAPIAAPTPTETVVQQLAEQIITGQQQGVTDTTVTIRYPGMFNQATVTLTEMDTAQDGQVNVRFSNLSPEAQAFMNGVEARQQLMTALNDKGITVHILVATEQADETLQQLSTNDVLSRQQDEEEQQEQQQQEENMLADQQEDSE